MQSTEWHNLVMLRRLAAAICMLSTLALALHVLTFARTLLDDRRSFSSFQPKSFPEGDGFLVYDAWSMTRPLADSHIDAVAVHMQIDAERTTTARGSGLLALKYRDDVAVHAKSVLESQGFPENARQRILAVSPQGGLLGVQLTPSYIGLGVRALIAVALFLCAIFAMSMWWNLSRHAQSRAPRVPA